VAARLVLAIFMEHKLAEDEEAQVQELAHEAAAAMAAACRPTWMWRFGSSGDVQSSDGHTSERLDRNASWESPSASN
jgi:hypothetical protein